jgi:ribosome maturation factor RimP
MRNKRTQQLIEALEGVAVEHGFELVDIEILQAGRQSTVRVYLDRAAGLTLDDIAAANRWVSACIEALDPFAGSYVLEVSSPGVDRPLRTREHFARFAGERAVVQTRQGEGRSKWSGILKGMENGAVLIEVDGAVARIDFDAIKKAHVVGTIDFSINKQDVSEGNDDVV